MRHLAILTLAVLALVLAACGTATHSTASHQVTAPVVLSALQTCQRLRADVIANGGSPDVPTLSYILAHTQNAQLASDASGAISDVQHGSGFLVAIDLAGFSHDCRGTGVQIPVPGLSG